MKYNEDGVVLELGLLAKKDWPKNEFGWAAAPAAEKSEAE